MLPADQRKFDFADFHLAANAAALYRGQELVQLEPQACRVLLYLVENHNRLVTKDELLENVWPDVFTTDDVLKKAVSQIRRALDDNVDNPRFVQTLHRRGYRFIAAVTENSASNAELITKKNSTGNGFNAFQLDQPTFLEDASDPDFDQLIGRAIEMELLQAEFRRVLRGHGQPVLITGDPGAGKTQLATRFERWATEQTAVCLRARFFDYEAARVSSYDLFLDLLNEALSKSSLGHGTKRTDLRAALKMQTGVALPEELFATNAGAKRLNAQSDAFRVIAPLAECFVNLSEKRPLVLVFDDLQWADETSLKIIGYLMRTASSAQLMLVATARRAEIETASHPISAWLQAQAVYRSYTSLNLTPLTLTEYRQLIDEIFGGKLNVSEIPASDLRQLYGTTGGNPYFLVETLRILIAENAVEKTTPDKATSDKITAESNNSSFLWRWRGLTDVPLPETVRMAARSKLARLSPQTRDYVERAAVLGDAFHLEALEQMFEGDAVSQNELETFLGEAVSAQVLTEQAVSGTDDCQFYHTTLRRAVYSDLSPRRRKRLHARAAAALESIYSGSPERIAAALAAHYETAGNARSSFERSLTACETASAHFDWTDAADSLARAQRAAGLLNGNSATRLSDKDQLRLLLASGETLMSVGKRVEAEVELTKAATLAEKLDDRQALAAALGVKAQTQVLLGRYRESLLSSREALRLSRENNNSRGVANALLQIASAQYTLCEYDEACQVLETVINEFGEASYHAAVALGKLGWVRALQSRYREAKELLTRARAFHREAGDVRQRVVLALCLDWAEYGAGDYEAAVDFATKARDEAHNIGELYSESIAMLRIGKSRLAQGLYEEGENIFKNVLAKLAGKNAIHCDAEAVWFLGRAKSLNGDYTEAAPLLEGALATIREIGDREDEFRILIDLARQQNEQNNAMIALETATQAAQIAQEIRIPDGIGAALIELSAAHLALNQPREALQAAERARELLEAAGSGELWRGYYALAAALLALPPDVVRGEKEPNRITPESALHRSLDLLGKIRKQFAAADIERREKFTRAHQHPARLLYDLLLITNRSPEAAHLKSEWQFDLI